MKDTRYDDDNFIPPIENGEEMFKYRTLVKSLLSLEKKFTQEDFEFIRTEDRTDKFGYVNYQLHYFFFCIDWKYLYFNNPTMGKLTLYDIFVNTPTKDKKKKAKKLQESYLCLKALFDGEFEIRILDSLYSFKRMYQTILESISIGLEGYGLDKISRRKGIHELIRHIFTELANVDYEFEDFKEPYLDKFSRRSKILIVFERFVIANTFNEFYKTQFGLGVQGMFLSESAIIHILLRHTFPFKIYTNKASNAIHQDKKIKNGLGDDVFVTAHRLDETNDYPIGVIGDDGVFYMPDFSTNQEDYNQYLHVCIYNKLPSITNEIIKTSTYKLYHLLCKIVKILEERYDSSKKPNIIYFENMLYGIEVNTRTGNTIDTFFPLNSDFQVKNGILKKDFDSIINKDDIPNGFLRVIDNEEQ